MSDKFAGTTERLESPPQHLVEVTPDDDNDLPHVSRAINAGTAGKVKVTTAAGDTGVFTLVAGALFPVRVRRVWATGTTATGIVVFY